MSLKSERREFGIAVAADGEMSESMMDTDLIAMYRCHRTISCDSREISLIMVYGTVLFILCAERRGKRCISVGQVERVIHRFVGTVSMLKMYRVGS